MAPSAFVSLLKALEDQGKELPLDALSGIRDIDLELRIFLHQVHADAAGAREFQRIG
jgi:hypothetical protein